MFVFFFYFYFLSSLRHWYCSKPGEFNTCLPRIPSFTGSAFENKRLRVFFLIVPPFIGFVFVRGNWVAHYYNIEQSLSNTLAKSTTNKISRSLSSISQSLLCRGYAARSLQSSLFFRQNDMIQDCLCIEQFEMTVREKKKPETK